MNFVHFIPKKHAQICDLSWKDGRKTTRQWWRNSPKRARLAEQIMRCERGEEQICHMYTVYMIFLNFYLSNVILQVSQPTQPSTYHPMRIWSRAWRSWRPRTSNSSSESVPQQELFFELFFTRTVNFHMLGGETWSFIVPIVYYCDSYLKMAFGNWEWTVCFIVSSNEGSLTLQNEILNIHEIHEVLVQQKPCQSNMSCVLIMFFVPIFYVYLFGDMHWFRWTAESKRDSSQVQCWWFPKCSVTEASWKWWPKMHLDRIVDHGQSWFHAVSMAK